MKKRITVLCLTVLILLGGYFAANKTYSWLFQSGSGVTEAEFSQVVYLPSMSTPDENAEYGSFLTTTEEREDGQLAYVYLGKELLKDSKPLLLENRSGVETNVRLRIYGQVRDGSTGTTRALGARQIEGIWYLGVADDGGVNVVPLLQLTLGAGDDGSFWKKAEDGSTSGISLGGVSFQGPALQWDLQVPDGNGGFTASIPASTPTGTRYPVIQSMKTVDSMTLGGAAENTFYELYGKKDVTIVVEYYAKQAEAMDWSDWPATYRTEVVL